MTAIGKTKTELRSNDPCCKILAYVEWFSAIVQPCYLIPRFEKEAKLFDKDSKIPVDGDNCLELVDKFWINSFQDQLTYQTVF